jgi:hypothetical protein
MGPFVFALPLIRVKLSNWTWVLFLALLILVVAFVFSFFHKGFNGDEGIIAEHAYWLQKIGYARSVMAEGLGLGWENRHYHYHKFFVLTGSAVISLVGLSLAGLRSISLGFFLLFIYFLRRYFSENKDAFDSNEFYVCLLTLLLQSTVFDFAFLYRPEVMMMSLGFISFYFLQKGGLQSNGLLIHLSAALAGLCAFTHLNGLAFLIAGVGWLIFHKKYLPAVTYLLVGSLFTALYFFDITTTEDFHHFLHQVMNSPIVNETAARSHHPLQKILGEHMRFFHSPREMVFSSLFFLSLLFQFTYLKRHHKSLLLYLLLLMISLSGISSSYRPYYALIYYPHMALIIAIGTKRLSTLTIGYRSVFYAGCLAYVVVNAFLIYSLVAHRVDVEQESEKISRYLPEKHVAVMAGEFFFFNQGEQYRIHLPAVFEMLFKDYYAKTPTQKDFFQFAGEQGNQYIIVHNKMMSQDMLNLLHCDTMKVSQRIETYTVWKKDKDLTIFRLTP